MANSAEHAMVPAGKDAEVSAAASSAAAQPLPSSPRPRTAESPPTRRWAAVPNLATMLGALPVGYQEHVAMLLWGTADLKIWFTEAHGDDPDRSEYPQFFMSRLSTFHIQVGGKFLPGDTVLVTLHDALSHEMIRHEDSLRTRAASSRTGCTSRGASPRRATWMRSQRAMPTRLR